MSVSDEIKNRGAHGDSSFMLGRLRPSSENPPDLSVGSVRDPKRIDKFCWRLAEAWKKVPDWRF